MKFKFLVIILFCLCCATAKGQNVSQTLVSNGCSFAMVDTFSPRYAMMRHGKDIVAWNIDSEQKMTLKVDNGQEDSFIIPYFHNQEYGIPTFQYNERQKMLKTKYSIYSVHNNKLQKEFEADNGLFSGHTLRINNQNCIALIKEDLTYTIRSIDTWQIQNEGSNNVISKHEANDPISFSRLTDRFYIESFISSQNEVRIWDCVAKKRVISFSGKPSLRIPVDKSGEYGAFVMQADSLTSQGKLYDSYNEFRQHKRVKANFPKCKSAALTENSSVNRLTGASIIQIRNLSSGKIHRQIIYDNLHDSFCFSPADSQLLLIVSNRKPEAILWKYSTFDSESGEIMLRINLPVNRKGDQQCCGYNGNIIGCTFSSDGKRIIFFTEELKAYIYSAETGKFLKSESISPLPIKVKDTRLKKYKK